MPSAPDPRPNSNFQSPAPSVIHSSAPRPKTSRLAVAALVLAVLPFRSSSSLLGAVLGLMAVRKLQFSGGSLVGRKLAIAAALVGFVMTALLSLVMSVGSNYLTAFNRKIMVDQIEEVVRAAA